MLLQRAKARHAHMVAPWETYCSRHPRDTGGINSDAPDVKIIPPLVYLAGIVIGFLANIWMPVNAFLLW